MSRMTTAQVIALGEYLDSDFEPAALTVSQLLGVLGFHNIRYPTPYTKGKLVQLFNEEIKANSAKLRKERIKKESSIASEDGITDGVTGKPLVGERAPVVRRTSRRLSRVPTQEQDTSPVRPDPPKRRRSSAQPNLGGPSRKVPAIQPTLTEESEPEEELPKRKVGRSKKSMATAGSQARRVSQPVTEDSGWEDNNIFQSGAESSSPVRSPPIRPKATRKSIVPRKSRKSMSAPPQITSSPSPPRLRNIPQRLPPQSNFEPELPSAVNLESRRVTKRDAKGVFTSQPRQFVVESAIKDELEDDIADDSLNLVDGDSGVREIEMERTDSLDDLKEEATDDEEDKENQTIAISRRIAAGGKSLARRGNAEVKQRSLFVRFLFALIALAASGAVANFKMESAPIGFCDKGSNTNDALEQLKGKWIAEDACRRENRTLLYLPPLGSENGDYVDETPCPPLPLVPLPHPQTCTPCPDHATCSQHSLTCDSGYLLRSHPLVFFLPPPPSSPLSWETLNFSSSTDVVWKLISVVADGLPGLGPVALPPRCVEDPKRKRNIGALGKAVESMLGQERGRRLCAGTIDAVVVPEDEGGEAKKWGVELDALREVIRRKTSPHLLASFDDTMNEAIQQLIQWGGIILGEDSTGKRYVAHKTADLTVACSITVKSREIWAEWRATVIGIAMAILGAYGLRYRRGQQQIENKRVAELVQIALDTLRNQELAHHTDPITAPHVFLSSLQLRDLILQDEHSIPTRRRLWDQVERVVEGNANVRANLEEVQGGDELRVWRWVGSAGRGSGVQRRVFGEEKGEVE